MTRRGAYRHLVPKLSDVEREKIQNNPFQFILKLFLAGIVAFGIIVLILVVGAAAIELVVYLL